MVTRDVAKQDGLAVVSIPNLQMLWPTDRDALAIRTGGDAVDDRWGWKVMDVI